MVEGPVQVHVGNRCRAVTALRFSDSKSQRLLEPRADIFFSSVLPVTATLKLLKEGDWVIVMGPLPAPQRESCQFG